MKIVHVVYSMEMGGAEMLVAQLCRIQRTNGHDVTVCAYSTLGTLGETLRGEGIPVHVLGEAHPAKTILRYLRLFQSMKPDVVHTHNPAPTLQAAIGARIAGASAIVATRHSLVAPPYDTAAEIKFNLISWFTDWIAGICEITCENVRHTPFARKSRIVRVYNGADPIPQAPPIEDTAGRFTLLFVGRLAAVKDLTTMIRAVAIAVRQLPGMQLWIVGDGAVRGELESLVQSLGIPDQVRFWGQRLDTPQFFRAADLFAMSSTSEGLPMSLLQAMSTGLPAVVTDVGGMREVLLLSGGGIRVPVGDVIAMAAAFVQLATDETLRTTCAERARAAYAKEFTLEQMDRAYMRLYQSKTSGPA